MIKIDLNLQSVIVTSLIGVLLIACTQQNSNTNTEQLLDRGQKTQIKSESPQQEMATHNSSPTENYGYEDDEELHAMTLISRHVISEYPYIAIVKELDVTYPDWPFGNPVDPDDGFVSGVRRYDVKRIRGLRGDLPEKFNYEIYGEASEFALRERVYPLAICHSSRVNAYVAKETIGRTFDDPRFVKLFLAEWEKSEPLDLSNKPCWFDEE